jgi:hypothetical protein
MPPRCSAIPSCANNSSVVTPTSLHIFDRLYRRQGMSVLQRISPIPMTSIINFDAVFDVKGSPMVKRAPLTDKARQAEACLDGPFPDIGHDFVLLAGTRGQVQGTAALFDLMFRHAAVSSARAIAEPQKPFLVQARYQDSMIDISRPITAACARLRAPSFLQIDLICIFTVVSLCLRSLAICLLVKPAAARRRT